jgi:hypothetical protein
MNPALRDALWNIGLGLVGTLLGAGLLKLIGWYVARRPIRTRARRLQDAKTQLKLLEKLVSSDRAVLLFSFRVLFALITLGSGAVVLRLAFAQPPGSLLDPITVLNGCLWFFIALLSLYALILLGKLEDPKPPIETLCRRIEELERQDER